MSKVVLDTNVVVSALLKPGSQCDVILQLIFDQKVELVVCHEIIEEYRDVLDRPKFERILKNIKDYLFDYLELTKGKRITPIPTRRSFSQDPDDKVFYDLAVTADAFLVTGNTKHFPKESRVVTPTEFVDDYVAKQTE